MSCCYLHTFPSRNAQSIANTFKITELKMLLKEHDIHIVCIQETYLKQTIKSR